MSDSEQLNHLLSDDIKKEKETEENLALFSVNSSRPELEVEYLRTKLDRQKEENEGLRQDREQRKKFSYIIFGFLCAYMAVSLVAVYLVGFGCVCLSDTVLVALLTTSLANVIGVFNFVAKYLFPSK